MHEERLMNANYIGNANLEMALLGGRASSGTDPGMEIVCRGFWEESLEQPLCGR